MTRPARTPAVAPSGPPGPTLRYDVVDVFTDRPFAGNPLAVVHGAGGPGRGARPDGGPAPDGLSTAAMQAIAREFNLSETAFPLPPETAGADYRVRIFTPAAELAFAGHPSVGTAWVLARDGVIHHGDVVQECGAGLLPVTVDTGGARLTGGTPATGADLDAAELLAAVGLAAADADPAAAPGVASAGAEFFVVAVRPDAVARAVPDLAAIRALGHGSGPGQGLCVVAWRDGAPHVRMFAPDLGVGEDPATGSAAVAIGVFAVWRGLAAADGETPYVISQGAEIGRPSTLRCTVEAERGVATRTTVAGDVRAVASGEIAIPPAD